MDDNLAIWALWARPPGVFEGAFGGISSYGGDGSLDAVHHGTIDEVNRWRGRAGGGGEKEEEGPLPLPPFPHTLIG